MIDLNALEALLARAKAADALYTALCVSPPAVIPVVREALAVYAAAAKEAS